MLFFSVITQVRKSLIAKNVWFFSLIEIKMQVKSQFLQSGKKSNYGLGQRRGSVCPSSGDKRGPDHGAVLPLGQGELFLLKDTGMATQCLLLRGHSCPLGSSLEAQEDTRD